MALRVPASLVAATKNSSGLLVEENDENPFWVSNVEEGVKTCVKPIEKEVVQRPDHWHLWPVANQFFIKNN